MQRRTPLYIALSAIAFIIAICFALVDVPPTDEHAVDREIAHIPTATSSIAAPNQPSPSWRLYTDEELGIQFEFPSDFLAVTKRKQRDTVRPNTDNCLADSADLSCQDVSLFFAAFGGAPLSYSGLFMMAYGTHTELPARETGWVDVLSDIQSKDDIKRLCNDSQFLPDREDRAFVNAHCYVYVTKSGLPVAAYWQESFLIGFPEEERFFYTYIPHQDLSGGMAWTTMGLPEAIPMDKRVEILMRMLDTLVSAE